MTFKPAFGIIMIPLLLAATTCRCQEKTVHNTKSKKYADKHYSPIAIQKREGAMFQKLYHYQEHEQYKGKISWDTTHKATYIQFDSIRVYLFGEAQQFKGIFTSGLISGQMIYCAIDSTCIPSLNPYATDIETGMPFTNGQWGWDGYTITIDNLQLLAYAHSKPTQRRFMFRTYTFKGQSAGTNSAIFLELTNEKAGKNTDINTFIRGAKVTFMKKDG